MSIELADEELAQRAAKGDFRAFEELVRRYSPPLFKFAYVMLNDYEDASDVLQQVLIQLHTSLPRRYPTASFKNWAFTITRNKCLDHSRKRRSLNFNELNYKRNTEDELTVLEQLCDSAPSPEEIVERQDRRQTLHEAIARLPERDRAVVMLRYLTDLSFGEIGQILDLPEGSTKTCFQRAKQVLRDYLKHEL